MIRFARTAAPLACLLLACVPLPAAAEILGEDAPLCRSARGPAIQVDVQGLKDRRGEVWLELYPATQADFLRDDTDLQREGKTFRRTRANLPASGEVAICVRVPGPGRYALLLRHNRTGKDKFSFWSDGVGFPANRALGRSKPPLADAVVTAGERVTPVPIHMQYLRGLSGFAPR